MLGDITDNPDNTLAFNDLALFTNFLDGCPYLHDLSFRMA